LAAWEWDIEAPPVREGKPPRRANGTSAWDLGNFQHLRGNHVARNFLGRVTPTASWHVGDGRGRASRWWLGAQNAKWSDARVEHEWTVPPPRWKRGAASDGASVSD
jgi:hypothetical protein